MARISLRSHPKFKRLVHTLDEPVPHVLGYLECLWEVAYQTLSDKIGDALDVGLACLYPGDAEKITAALHERGFLDLVDGVYYIHDLADHAPDFVKKRLLRICQRRQTAPNGDNLDKTAPNGAENPETAPNGANLEQPDQKRQLRKEREAEGGEAERSKAEGGGEEPPNYPPPLETEPKVVSVRKIPKEPDLTGLNKFPATAAGCLEAWIFFFKGAGHHNRDQLTRQIEELNRVGIGFDRVIEEIADPDRFRGEAFFKLTDRLAKAREPPKKRSPPLKNAADWKKEDAEREAMIRKEQEAKKGRG